MLGNPKIDAARDQAVAAIKAGGDRAAKRIAEIRKSDVTILRAIAEALNARGVRTPAVGDGAPQACGTC
jgi:hypothetical protein